MSHMAASSLLLRPLLPPFTGACAARAPRPPPRRLVVASRPVARAPHLRDAQTCPAAHAARSEIAVRCASVDNDAGAGGEEEEEVDPYARLWPWGDYFPEFAEESFQEVQERFSRESKDARAALKDEVAGFFRPLLDCFDHLRSLKTGFDTEDYHVGMPFGALVACVGCYRLCKMNPSMFLDAALGYAFYRLSVVSLKLRRQGLSNDLFTRVKFVILVIMAVNDFKNNLCLLDGIRIPVYFLYLTTFLYEVFGFKKYVKYVLGGVFVLLQFEEGREIIRDVVSELVPQSDNEL